MRTEPLPRQCRNADGKPKLRFAVRAEAKEAVRTAAPFDVHLKLYRCQHCGFFHLATIKEPAA